MRVIFHLISLDYTQGKGVATVFHEIFAMHIILIFNS